MSIITANRDITLQQHTATAHCNGPLQRPTATALQQNMETHVPMIYIIRMSIVEGIKLQQHTAAHCNSTTQ